MLLAIHVQGDAGEVCWGGWHRDAPPVCSWGTGASSAEPRLTHKADSTAPDCGMGLGAPHLPAAPRLHMSRFLTAPCHVHPVR